jgi:hypothetical protein
MRSALAVGIADGERCLLVGDQQFARSVLRQLDSRTMDASNGTDKGVVIHLTGQDNGIALLGSIMCHIETRSHNGVRIVDCPAWGRKGWSKLNDLLAFECVMDEITRRYRALYSCIYDERVASRLRLLCILTQIIVNGRVADNPSYVRAHNSGSIYDSRHQQRDRSDMSCCLEPHSLGSSFQCGP